MGLSPVSMNAVWKFCAPGILQRPRPSQGCCFLAPRPERPRALANLVGPVLLDRLVQPGGTVMDWKRDCDVANEAGPAPGPGWPTETAEPVSQEQRRNHHHDATGPG